MSQQQWDPSWGPSPALQYRIGMLAEAGREPDAETLERMFSAVEFDDLSEADRTAIVEAEVAVNGAGGRLSHPGGTRDFSLEDDIIDESGLLALGPLPTPPGVPAIPGIPFVGDDGRVNSNPVDAEPGLEHVTDEPGDLADPDDYPDDGELDGWVGL